MNKCTIQLLFLLRVSLLRFFFYLPLSNSLFTKTNEDKFLLFFSSNSYVVSVTSSLATPPRALEAVRLLQPNAPQPITLLRPFILGGLLLVGIEPPT